MPAEIKDLRRKLVTEHGRALRDLHRISPIYNSKIAAFLGLWALGAWLTTLGPVGWVPGWGLATAGLLGNAILMHDAAHHTLARSGAWNRWLGFVCGAPALISATAYRVNHVEHHAFIGTDRDSGDPVAHANRTGWPMRRLVRIFLVLGTFLVLPAIAQGGWRKSDGSTRREIAVEYALIALGVVVGLALAPPALVLHGWAIPFVLGSIANNIRSLAEHAWTDRADPLRNARTIEGDPLLNLVQSNVNYHWEHHLFPGVPWYHLPALHRLVAGERRAIGVPVHPGYLSWMRDVVWPGVRPE